LRKPLTVETAVQIALLNNRSLQATFEDIGLPAADLIEAAAIPNPMASGILSSSPQKPKRCEPSANTSRPSETTGLLEQNWNEQSAATSVRGYSEMAKI
jgi:hypothetical protein